MSSHFDRKFLSRMRFELVIRQSEGGTKWTTKAAKMFNIKIK